MTLEISVTLDYTLDAPSDALLQIEAADLTDQSLARVSLEIDGAPQFTHIDAEHGVGQRIWLTTEETLVCHYHANVAVTRDIPDLSAMSQDRLSALPGEAVSYLMPSHYCPSQEFQSFVSAQFGDLVGGTRVEAMSDWIARHISYVSGSSGPHTTAKDTFIQRQGICRDFAHVMITLSRASAIPARMASIYAPDVEPPDFHAVAQVWLNGGWRLVDPTGMAQADEIAIIGVGRDAADVAFMTVWGNATLRNQEVTVKRS